MQSQETSNPSAMHQKILIILPRQLGDILLGSSLAFALREHYPGAHIDWLSHPMGRQLLTGHPALNTIHFHPLWKSVSWQKIFSQPLQTTMAYFKYIVSELQFVRMIRAEKYDVVVDSICTPRTALLTWNSRAKLRIGLFTRWNRNWAYTWLCQKKNWLSQYAAQARLELLEPLIPAEKIKTPPQRWLNSWIPNSPQFSEKVSEWLRETQLNQHNFAILSPTHRRPLRRWPTRSYTELAVKLAREFQWHIVWLWGPGELEFVQSIHNDCRSQLTLAGLNPGLSIMAPALNLPEAAQLSKHCEIWIGNSNGLSHVAMAGGARTIQIHGPTTSAPWTHPDSIRHRAVQRSMGCVRCETNVCRQGNHECLEKLSVDDVFDGVVKIKTASQH